MKTDKHTTNLRQNCMHMIPKMPVYLWVGSFHIKFRQHLFKKNLVLFSFMIFLVMVQISHAFKYVRNQENVPHINNIKIMILK